MTLKCAILGSGGSVNTPARHNTSLLLRSGADSLLVDCNGVCAQRLYALGQPLETLQHVFLTHEHIDHIGALPSLIHQIWVKSCLYAAERRTAPLHLYGNSITLEKANRLIDTVGLRQHPHIFPIESHLLEQETGIIRLGEMEIEYFPVCHGPAPCLGMSWRGERGGFVYSADTEPCDAVFGRLRAGDVLLHDCNKIDRPESPEHTSWAQLATRLAEAPPVRTYLLHLPLMTASEESQFAAQLTRDWGERVQLGHDAIEITIT